jgi:hypothetical protein
VTTYSCSGGSCGGSTSTETVSCTVPTVNCPAPVYGAWGACSATACGSYGSRSRSVTSYSCSDGSCIGSTSTETDFCAGTSCPIGRSCRCGEVCLRAGEVCP